MMFGFSLVLLLLGFIVAGGEAEQYLFDGALISAATGAGLMVTSIKKRRD